MSDRGEQQSERQGERDVVSGMNLQTPWSGCCDRMAMRMGAAALAAPRDAPAALGVGWGASYTGSLE